MKATNIKFENNGKKKKLLKTALLLVMLEVP